MEQYNPLIEEATENLQTFADQVEEASNKEYNTSMVTRNILYVVAVVIIIAALVITCIMLLR